MLKNINRVIYIALIIMILLFALVSCKQKTIENKIDQASKIEINYPKNLIDFGFTQPVVLTKKPSRVVAMANSPVMALYKMGVEMVGIPTTRVVKWPEDLLNKTTQLEIVMNANFDIESVVALNPDLVLIGKSHKDTYGRILTDVNIPVYYVDDGHVVSYESIKMLTKELINAFAKDSPSGQNIMNQFDALENRLEEQKNKNAGKYVMVLQSSPPAHYIQSSGGTLGNMLNMMGFENVYTDMKSPLVPLDMEQAILYEPDLFFAVGASETQEEFKKIMEEDFAKNPNYWNEIKAIKDGNTFYLPISFITSGGIDVIDKINQLIDIVEKNHAK